MIEVSNRTLVFLLGLALFFSVFGIVMVLDKLGIQPLNLITGAPSAIAGKVNVTVATTVSIAFNRSFIDFGNGTNSGGVNLTADGATDNPNTFRDSIPPIMFENDGNVEVNISVNGTNATSFISSGTSPTYRWKGQLSANRAGCNQNGTFNNVTFRDITTKFNCFCNNLSFVDTIDRVNFTVNLFVPADTAAATYTDSLLAFVASSAVGAQHAGGDCDGLGDT